MNKVIILYISTRAIVLNIMNKVIILYISAIVLIILNQIVSIQYPPIALNPPIYFEPTHLF